jgi:hypothetical protein
MAISATGEGSRRGFVFLFRFFGAGEEEMAEGEGGVSEALEQGKACKGVGGGGGWHASVVVGGLLGLLGGLTVSVPVAVFSTRNSASIISVAIHRASFRCC